MLETTDHITSTIPETTKRTDGTPVAGTEQDTTGTTPDMGTSSTSSGTTTSQGTTPGRSTTTSQSSSTSLTSTTPNQPPQTTTTEHETTYPQTPTTTELERTSVIETEPPEAELERAHYPQLPQLPQPPQYVPPARPPKNKGRISSEAEERTAMIIGIVAGALIAVILVILLLLWLKSTGDRPYKNEHDKSGTYGQGPNAALLGSNTGTNSSQLQHHHHQQTNGATVPLNGAVRNGSDKAQLSATTGNVSLALQKPKKRDSKDIKEWYV